MKTPKQLAEDAARVYASKTDRINVGLAVMEAIEADRAQRPTLDEAEFDQIAEAMSALTRGLERGREYITIADARAAEEMIRSKFGPALHDSAGQSGTRLSTTTVPSGLTDSYGREAPSP